MSEDNSDYELARTEIEFLKLRAAFDRLDFEKQQAILKQQIEKFTHDRQVLKERKENNRLIQNNILKISMSFIVFHIVLIIILLLVLKYSPSLPEKSQSSAALVFMINGLILSMSAVMPLLAILDRAPSAAVKWTGRSPRLSLTRAAYVISKFFLLAALASSMIAVGIVGYALLRFEMRA